MNVDILTACMKGGKNFQQQFPAPFKILSALFMKLLLLSFSNVFKRPGYLPDNMVFISDNLGFWEYRF
jgi:hypothetical protein